MTHLTTRLSAACVLLLGLALARCDTADPGDAHAPEGIAPAASAQPFAVAGSAVHYFSQAVVHSQEQTAGGMIQRSTDYIELTGDLSGYILYHPTSVIDNTNGTLVNTGTQIFSGTVAGSAPVLLHDDSFRFEIDLNSGATTGVVHLGRSKDAPDRGGWFECDLEVTGTGVTPEGDNLSDYSGTCTARGNRK